MYASFRVPVDGARTAPAVLPKTIPLSATGAPPGVERREVVEHRVAEVDRGGVESGVNEPLGDAAETRR